MEEINDQAGYLMILAKNKELANFLGLNEVRVEGFPLESYKMYFIDEEINQEDKVKSYKKNTK